MFRLEYAHRCCACDSCIAGESRGFSHADKIAAVEANNSVTIVVSIHQVSSTIIVIITSSP